MKIRTLREGEPFPQHLGTGYESMPVMNSFCWVAEDNEKITGILMAAPCHGLLYFVRLRVVEGSVAATTLLLCRRAMRDAKEMGFTGYFTHIDPARESEAAMISIFRRAGGFQIPTVQVPLAGSIEKAVRF